MAERLTRNNKFSIYNQNNLETMYDKLAEIEDTMEEYGIESVEELGKKLADGITWKRACELACDDLGLYEDITITQLKMKCYYQQAKKEQDENKN